VELIADLPASRDRERLARAAIAESLARLEVLSASLKDEDLSICIDVIVGKPWVEAVREVLREKHDLVILAAKRDPNGHLDSFTQHVARKCPCPVWLYANTPSSGTTKVLAAIGAQKEETSSSLFDRRILALGASIREQLDAELDVVNAWYLPGQELLLRRAAAPELVTESRGEWRRIASRRFQRLIDDCHFIDRETTSVHQIEGRASEVISGFAREQETDLIVMGTVGRTGTAGLIIGNTAEEVLQKSACSLLLLKPKGFVSPVKLR